jgi:hypothetical protein
MPTPHSTSPRKRRTNPKAALNGARTVLVSVPSGANRVLLGHYSRGLTAWLFGVCCGLFERQPGGYSGSVGGYSSANRVAIWGLLRASRALSSRNYQAGLRWFLRRSSISKRWLSL